MALSTISKYRGPAKATSSVSPRTGKSPTSYTGPTRPEDVYDPTGDPTADVSLEARRARQQQAQQALAAQGPWDEARMQQRFGQGGMTADRRASLAQITGSDPNLMNQIYQQTQQSKYSETGDGQSVWPKPYAPSGNYQYGPGRPGPTPPGVPQGGVRRGGGVVDYGSQGIGAGERGSPGGGIYGGGGMDAMMAATGRSFPGGFAPNPGIQPGRPPIGQPPTTPPFAGGGGGGGGQPGYGGGGGFDINALMQMFGMGQGGQNASPFGMGGGGWGGGMEPGFMSPFMRGGYGAPQGFAAQGYGGGMGGGNPYGAQFAGYGGGNQGFGMMGQQAPPQWNPSRGPMTAMNY